MQCYTGQTIVSREKGRKKEREVKRGRRRERKGEGERERKKERERERERKKERERERAGILPSSVNTQKNKFCIFFYQLYIGILIS